MKNHRTVILLTLIVLVAVLVVVSIFAFAYAGSANPIVSNPGTTSSGANGYNPNNWIGNGWSNMMSCMGGYFGSSSTAQTSATTQNVILPFVGFAAMIGAVITGAGGAFYFLASSRIRIASMPAVVAERVDRPIQKAAPIQDAVTPYVSVSKVLTPEESKVMDILVAHNGKYLQKYIRIEGGLSRLKTHRIVLRLAERGIVTLEKSGNTNEVHLSSWLKPNFEKCLPTQKYEGPIGIEGKV
jgi:uncharacterized membrane protein